MCHTVREEAGGEYHSHQCEPREGSPDAHRFQGQVVDFSQVERQPCEEYVHDVVDDEELDAIDGSVAEGDDDIAPEADTDDDIAEDEE